MIQQCIWEQVIPNDILCKEYRVKGSLYDIDVVKMSDTINKFNKHDFCIRVTRKECLNYAPIDIEFSLPPYNYSSREILLDNETKYTTYQALLYPVTYSNNRLTISRLPWEPFKRDNQSEEESVIYTSLHKDETSGKWLGHVDTEVEEHTQTVNPSEIRLDIPLKGSFYIKNETWDKLWEIKEKLPSQRNVESWVILDFQDIVWLIVSRKIEAIIRRSMRSGSAPQHVMLQALGDLMTSHYVQPDISNTAVFTPYWGSSQHGLAISNNRYLQFATRQGVKAAHMPDLVKGAYVENRKLNIDENSYSPFTEQLLINPFVSKLDAHRYPVAVSSVRQAAHLFNPDEPVVRSWNTNMTVSAANLLIGRFVCEIDGYTTYNDGILISETGANKLLAIKDLRIKVPSTAEIFVEPYMRNDETLESMLELANDNNIITDNKIIANDITEGYIHAHTNGYKYIVTEIRESQQSKIIYGKGIAKLIDGDKLADLHGNKGTISKIIPTSKMPYYMDGNKKIHLDIIMEPWICKRGCISSRMEDRAGFHIYTHRNLEECEVRVETYNPQTGKCITIEELENITDSNEKTIMLNSKEFKAEVGYVQIIRLKHFAKDKASYSNKAITNEAGLTMQGYGNIRFPDIYHIATEPEKLIDEIAADVDNINIRLTAKRMLEAIGINCIDKQFTLKTPILSREATNGYIDITKKIERGLLISSLPSYFVRIINSKMLDEEYLPPITELDNTILDPRLRATPGRIKLPSNTAVFGNISNDNSYIVYPSGLLHTIHIEEVGHILSDIHKRANRVVSEIEWYNILLESNTSVSTIVSQRRKIGTVTEKYISTILQTLTGKGGLIRELLLPRASASAISVLQSTTNIDPTEVMIPRRMLVKLAENPWIRMVYNIHEEDNPELFRGKYALVARNPVHNTEMIALKIVPSDEKHLIRVNDITLDILNGDRDGDMVCVRFAKTIRGYNEMKQFLPKQPWHGSKYLEHADTKSEIEKATRHAIGQTSTLHYLGQYENEKYKDKFKDLLQRDFVSPKELELDIRIAGRNYFLIKQGTSQAGGIGNKLRAISYAINNNKVPDEINEAYHVLAQAVLDAKSPDGRQTTAVDIIEHINKGKTNHLYVESKLSKLGLGKKSIDAVNNILTLAKRSNSTLTSLAKRMSPAVDIIMGQSWTYGDLSCITQESFSKNIYGKQLANLLSKP